MPKRRNPYADSFQPQIKTHVGIREFKNTPDRMKPVYDKTIAMLFEAANQKNNNGYLQKNESEITSRKEIELLKQSKTMKQLFLGNNGVLQTQGEVLPVETSDLCSSCLSQPADSWLSCGYCERPLCSTCSLLCCSCSGPTCHNCSVDSFRDTSGVLCLSCCR